MCQDGRECARESSLHADDRDNPRVEEVHSLHLSSVPWGQGCHGYAFSESEDVIGMSERLCLLQFVCFAAKAPAASANLSDLAIFTLPFRMAFLSAKKRAARLRRFITIWRLTTIEDTLLAVKSTSVAKRATIGRLTRAIRAWRMTSGAVNRLAETAR